MDFYKNMFSNVLSHFQLSVPMRAGYGERFAIKNTEVFDRMAKLHTLHARRIGGAACFHGMWLWENFEPYCIKYSGGEKNTWH